ncbi:MAG: hypothetical protein JWO46_2176 [Nocardioidaceae bacterium]|nr:hypothetical protein [Nocardioidaceae bacterium]
MARRVSLPSADDLFRTTSEPPEPSGGAEDVSDEGVKRPSGRVRHDEKMTVYVTSDELMDVESARLALRAKHGLVVDRGRLIREAVAMVLADLEAQGDESPLVRRLTGR